MAPDTPPAHIFSMQEDALIIQQLLGLVCLQNHRIANAFCFSPLPEHANVAVD
jgi:hypothetical protein